MARPEVRHEAYEVLIDSRYEPEIHCVGPVLESIRSNVHGMERDGAPEQRKDNVKKDNVKTEPNFVDHYEVLQVSQHADAETVERVYRLLAKRYHPDNTSSGDESRFCAVREAFEVLSDPERRARFDVRYDDQTGARWRIFSQEEALNDHQRDQRIFHGVLSLLYAARRRDPQAGGLGAMHLEETLGVPREHLEFPMWYLKQRGLVETLSSGMYAITIDGIEWLGHDDRSIPDNRLLPKSTGETGSQNGAHADSVTPAAP